MGAIAAILVALGIVGLIWGGLQKHKAGRLAGTPLAKTGDAATKGEAVAGPKGAISVEGDVKCAAPLTSPATGTPCLYYELQVVGTWKEGDTNKSQDYVTEKKAAEFTLDDGSGPVKILAEKGGDFDLEKTFDETKKEGFLADLKSAVGKGEPIIFGKYSFANPAMSKADKFNCVEKVLKAPPRLFALGKLEGGAIGQPSWASLILSPKSRDELLGKTAKAAKNFLIGGGAVVGVGLILGIVSMVIAQPSADAATPTDQAAPTANAAPSAADVVSGAEAAADAKGAPPATPDAADAAAPTDAAAPADAAPAAGGICAKAAACCKIVNTKGAKLAACDKLVDQKEPKCKKALLGFKKTVKAKSPKRLAECE